MSDSNRGDKRILITNIVGATVTAVIVAVLVWTASSNYTEIRVEAESYAKHYSDSTVKAIEQTCLGADIALRIKCETEIVNATREANHDAKDLNAQRQSAYWGFWREHIGYVSDKFILLPDGKSISHHNVWVSDGPSPYDNFVGGKAQLLVIAFYQGDSEKEHVIGKRFSFGRRFGVEILNITQHFLDRGNPEEMGVDEGIIVRAT